MIAVRRFLAEESATTAVEYAVMLALILVACFGAITAFGSGQSSRWSSIDSKLNAVGF